MVVEFERISDVGQHEIYASWVIRVFVASWMLNTIFKYDFKYEVLNTT